VEQYLPLILGRVAEGQFHAGDVEAARAPILRALACCEAGNDPAGIYAYLGNLYELQRYRGEAGPAADTLERMAGLRERNGDAAKARAHQRQAAIVRAGEPLCRVVVEVEGQRFELSDLPAFGAARFTFIFQRNRITLRSSLIALARGERAGAAGEYAPAVEDFERASSLDRFDPAPHYQRGLTLLHLRRYDEAAAAYATAEELAPGYFHVRSDSWLAERLAAGELSHEAFLLLRHLFDGSAPAEEKAETALSGLREVPIALLYLAAGDALSELDRQSDAVTLYRSGLAIAEEPDVHTRLLVALAVAVTDHSERNELFRGARELRGNLVAAATAELGLRQEADS
jgi:tetratricopeptide (TPR) repeat protein